MTDLWSQLALTESVELKSFESYIARREEQRLVQFLMALRSDFEGLRGTILHRTPLPSIDSIVHELIAEETRLKSHSDKGSKASSAPAVFAANSHSQRQQTPRVAPDECAFCKKKNHWKAQCPLLLAKGKQSKPEQPKNQTPRGPPWTVRPPPFAAAASSSADNAPIGTPPPSALDPDVFESFRKYIAENPTALSATLGYSAPASSGKSGIPSSWWILDSGATHHMSHNMSCFSSLLPVSSINVTSASDSSMVVEGIGSVSTSHITLSDVYYIPNLNLNLVSVSKLCNSGNWVFFSDSVCIVQDQHSQNVIGIGRKLGELYVLEVLQVSPIVRLVSTCLLFV